MKHIYISLLTIAATVFMFTACVKDQYDIDNLKISREYEWNPHLAVPVAYGDLTLSNLVKEREDTIMYISENNSKLNYGQTQDCVLVVRYGMDSARSMDFLRLPTMQPYDTTITLDPITLSNITAGFSNTITSLLQDNFSNTDYTDYVAYSSGPQPVTVTERTANSSFTYSTLETPITALEYAVIKSGTLTATCVNTFTVPIQTDIEVYTERNGTPELIYTFPFSEGDTWIQPGMTGVTKTFTFNDTYIEDKISYKYTNLKIGAATGVTVDINLPAPASRLTTVLVLENLVASEGRAVVPQQTIAVDTTIYASVNTTKGIDKMYLLDIEKGAIAYKMTSSIDIAIEVGIEFPSMTQNGIPVTKTAILNSSNPVTENHWDLAGHIADLTTNPAQVYNSLPIKFNYKVETNPNELISFGPTQTLKIEISNPDSIAFNYLEGNLGKSTEDLPADSISFDLGGIMDMFSGEIVFHDPRLNIYFENTVGMAGQLELNITGETEDGTIVDLFDGYTNTFNISKPTCNEVKVGTTKSNLISINKQTSNIVNFLKALPNSIKYSGKFIMNTDYLNEADIENCASNKGKTSIELEVEVPMNLSIKDFTLEEEIIMNASDIENLHELDTVQLVIETDNQFPLDADLQLTFLDTTNIGNEILDSLDIIVLEGATAMASGKVSRNTSNIHTEIIGGGPALLATLKKSNKILIKAVLNTTKETNNSVILYSYYTLGIKIGVNGKFLLKGRF